MTEADEGITGTKVDKREEFQRMINDCHRGKIDRILTKSISRFARNTVDTIKYARTLKKCGVSILFEADQIDTAYLSSEMLLALSGARAQEESISISKNQRINCRARMKDGSYIASATPFGYRLRDDGELDTVPEEVEIVRLIFDSYLSGMGIRKIADMLNEQQVSKRFGRIKWHHTTIAYILKNERYMGDTILQKTYTTETLPFRRLKNDGHLSRYYIENANLPIISREQFEEAQALLRGNHPERNIQVRKYPLTRKLLCSCGHVYTLSIVNNTRYWECYEHNQDSRHCNSRRIPEADIESAFIDMVNKLQMMRREVLGSAVAQVERLQKTHNGMQSKVHEIDRQIAELNGQNLVLARLHTKQIMSSADYAAQSGIISQKVRLLRLDRRKLLNQDENIKYLDGLTELENILSQVDCQSDFNKDLFKRIVIQITVPTHTSLCFELIGGLKLTMPIPSQRRRGK